MPIIDIEIVSRPGEDPVPLLAQPLAVARLTRRPAENVHVEFRPAARGRIAFGGRLVE